MLDGLDQIDWSRLSHAYGLATDVPELIRRLADGSSDAREEALSDLHSKIWHQGTDYEATAYAVPFLIELVTDPAIPDRGHILSLLQAIAEGWLNCQKYAAQPGTFISAETAKRHAVERQHYQAAHTAVANGLSALFDLLTDGEADVRVWTAFLLVLLTEHAADIAERLLEAINREKDDCSRAALQFAIVALAKNAANRVLTDVVIRRLTATFEDPPSDVVALGAGLALVQLDQDAVLPRMLDLGRSQVVRDNHAFEQIPWPGADTVYSLVGHSLEFAPREQLKWIIEGLNHSEPEIRSAAMGFGANLCERYRWGPGKLVARYVDLVDRLGVDERKMAVTWLRSMGVAGTAALESCRKHRHADVREQAAVQLNAIESIRKERDSWLIEKCPILLSSVASLIQTIERHQGSRKWDDEEKIRNAALQLGFHGPLAQPAVETLAALTHRDNPWTRIHGIRALWKITHDSDIVVPLLMANLNPEPVVFLVLDCLKQIGSAARSIARELHRILDSDRRFFHPYSGATCYYDEEFCEACAAALRAIEGAS